MNISKVSLGLTGCFFAAALSGCVVVSGGHKDPPPDDVIVVEPGALIVDVLIDGSQHPAFCDFYAVDEVNINFIDEDGDALLTTIPCGDSIIVDDVEPGFYTVEISLVAGGERVSDLVSVVDVEVLEGGETTVTADFPESSIN